jgi:RNA polymerase sigma factor (TIGR02999 family)
MDDFVNATQLLSEHVRGDPTAAERLMPVVYEELRRLAGHRMRSERPNHTLQATELVHEAFLKLIKTEAVDWQGRVHFLAVAARTMRQVLIDHARARQTAKRGSGAVVALPDDVEVSDTGSLDAVLLSDAIEVLAKLNERQAKIAEMRLFGGLTQAETAGVLGVSEDTVKKEWRLVRAWLRTRLGAEEG